MIKRIKDLLSNFSNQEEEIKDEKISSLDNANNGDIILVEPGVYNEQINFLDKNISLVALLSPKSPCLLYG